MFIETEVTPNPATLKFLPGRPVMEVGTFEARDLDEAERSPLAKALMQIPGVSGVFFAPDFISVTKGDADWQHLRPAILGVVTEHYLSGAPLLAAANRVVALLRAALGPGFPIIGVGGVTSAADALSKQAAGADIVQIYTGFIYKGPQLVTQAARALSAQKKTAPP